MLELVCGQSAGGSLKMAKNGADFAGDARDVLCPELALSVGNLRDFPPQTPLAAPDLAYLIAPEGEGELGVVRRDVFCERDRQIETQREVRVALHEAVSYTHLDVYKRQYEYDITYSSLSPNELCKLSIE